ncbi:unnamed protein product [Rotaria sp. Silwood1]|nr:unnamed protein product [Rotaria sp. Silwood1]CAF1409013.1 unnamed protein product [Rotaria sp. Silwood1]CAF3579919.1 unnamed protein product [Rotaria sp. Silwood1]CAF3600436.1 unnamed protein product [Rotaria sp. Silwood1]CAF4668078.1 unnamed protein product [Rotaria sp. Silwood1]
MITLEQLYMLILMNNNIDQYFEQYKSQFFLPDQFLSKKGYLNSYLNFLSALCDTFNDPLIPTHVLEVTTVRTLTYFLNVSVDCAKKK